MLTRNPKPISSRALGRSIPALLFALLLLAGAAIAPLPAYAASIVVNDAGDTTGTCATTGTGTCTLRDAITFANSNAGADTITFSISNATIALGSTLPTIGEDLTIDGTGQNITIDGQNNVQIMSTAFSSLTLNVTALKFIRGNAPSPESGGAIRANSPANLNVTGCTFDGNVAATAGGAIYASGVGTLTVTNSAFSSNYANLNNGGAIWSSKDTTNISNSTFTTNHIPGSGGAIYILGTLNVSKSTFDRNYTTNSVGGGGAILNNGGTTNVANSTFSGNYTAGSLGGGAISNSTFGYLNVINSTLSGNYTTGAGTGGGIHYDTTSTSDRMTLKNTIIANSSSGGDCVGTAKSPDSINNLIEDSSNACGLTNGSNGNIVGTDPNLAALADNGGPTQTMALNSGSAAIDTGDATVCAAAPVSNRDQRNYIRPAGAGCDIGAFESGATTAVTLAVFTARAAGNAVTLAWTTLAEADVIGFNVYRTAGAGPTTRINAALIPAQGDALTGASYTYADAPGAGAFSYELEAVLVGGGAGWHGPVMVQVAPYSLFLPMVAR
jgi:CSLREA domain-containing protein